MTLDEAIKHCLEKAEENENCANKCEAVYGEDNGIIEACRECVAEYRQLADWLTELKEAKRLLKAAVEDINYYVDCYEAHCDECCCDHDNHCHWKHEDEALKLIGGTDND